MFDWTKSRIKALNSSGLGLRSIGHKNRTKLPPETESKYLI